jgi:flagellar assembly protein FliH
MNTSANRALVSSPSSSQRKPEPQPFPYTAVAGVRRAGRNALADDSPIDAPSEATAANLATRDAQSREQGRQQGLNEARKAFEEQLTQERSNLAAAIEGFRKERADYFEKVEAEVVQLALGIARKILHREAQIDPMVLAGITRVGLDKIDGATRVTLRLHPQNTQSWRAFLASRLEPAAMPEIIEDPTQPPDRCTLETAMGIAEIGLEVQLKEIERGLADLLAARRETSE